MKIWLFNLSIEDPLNEITDDQAAKLLSILEDELSKRGHTIFDTTHDEEEV